MKQIQPHKTAIHRKKPSLTVRTIVKQGILKNSIFDFGCGTGQFAHMLIDNKIKYAYGVDFSEVAVNKAVVTVEAKFYQSDLYDLDTYLKHEYNTAIVLETLEHMEDDKAFFHKLPTDTRIILTVPDFDSVAHLRHFPDMQDVKDRYSDLMRISGTKTFLLGKKQIHLVHGRKI